MKMEQNNLQQQIHASAIAPAQQQGEEKPHGNGKP